MSRSSLMMAAVTVVALTLSACAPALSEEAKAQARELGTPLVVTGIHASPPNSAGGVDITILAVNVGDKPIKYIGYTVRAFNRVGDAVAGDISGSSTVRLRDTGPFAPGENVGYGTYWEAAIYNYSISCVQVESIIVTYFDNTAEAITGGKLQGSMARPGMNDCSMTAP